MVGTITLGGKVRPINYSINALIEFQELTGIDITEPEQRAKLTRMVNIRALAFVGLKHGCKAEGQQVDFTVDEVGDWLSMGTMPDIMKQFTKFMPPSETEKQEAEAEPVPN